MSNFLLITFCGNYYEYVPGSGLMPSALTSAASRDSIPPAFSSGNRPPRIFRFKEIGIFTSSSSPNLGQGLCC